MQNEIQSPISYIGAPSWFITFAPQITNIQYICIMQIPKTNKECHNLIAYNPVAGARFVSFSDTNVY